MNPEWEGFQQQAMALFAWQQVVRPTLPAKLTSKRKRRGNRACAKAGAAMMSNPHVRQCMWEALLYNMTRSEFSGYTARVYCFCTLAQYDAGTLATLEAVKTQVAVCPEPKATLPNNRGLVWARFEMLLTQADDVVYTDYHVRNVDVSAPKMEPYRLQWEKLQEQMKPKPDVSTTALWALVRCAACDKYSMDHRRCSGCHTVYYCDAACQNNHWPEHKTHCK